VSTFFGYFLLGPVLFTTAFIIGGGACFVAVRAGLDGSEASAWISVVAMLIGGGLSGFTAVKMLAIGMFAVGATFGVAVSAALKAALWSRFFPASPHAGFLFGSCVLGMLFGIIALTLRKKMLILTTSYAGAFAMFYGIGHFAGHFPSLRLLNEVEQGMFDPWAVFYLGLTALLGTAGMFLQLHLTRDKPMPSRAPYSRHRQRQRLRTSSRGSLWSLGEDAEFKRELLAVSPRPSNAASPRSVSRSPLELDERPSSVVANPEAKEVVSILSSDSKTGSWSGMTWTTPLSSNAKEHAVELSSDILDDVDCELGKEEGSQTASDVTASANAVLA
jgi:hypothetical protein